MADPNKILTVSYGTFSCTLEGFEDTFGTMKAIAEYFRDLAAQDRCFGAEPPTPDADTLAGIVQSGSARRVDARMDGTDIVLRAREDERNDAGSPRTEMGRPDDAVAYEGPATDVAQDDEAQNEAVQNALPNTAFERHGIDEPGTDEEAAIRDWMKAARAKSTSPIEPVAPALSTAADARGPATIPSDDAKSTAPTVDGQTPSTGHKPVGIAERLQRIREVARTSQNAPTDDFEAQFLPDVQTATETNKSGKTQKPDHAQINEMAQDKQLLTPNVDAEPEAVDETGAHVRSTAASSPEPATGTVQTDDPETGSDSQDESLPGPTKSEAAPVPRSRKPRFIRLKRSDLRKTKPNEMGDETPARNPEADSSDTSSEDTTPNAAQSPMVLTNPNFAMLDGADDLEGFSKDDGAGKSTPDTDTPASEGRSDEPDIDFGAESSVGLEDDTTVPETPASRANETVLDDAALDRIMSKTNTQLQEPEGSRRRSAITQLKAAVAAKRAARSVGEPEDDVESTESAFRKDLSEAVLPASPSKYVSSDPSPRGDNEEPSPVLSRPVLNSGARTERPRAAPLRLVASQRIDVPSSEKPSQQADEAPVSPRRVSVSSTANTPEKTEVGFLDFAKDVGASELPDLMEAAAAYCVFVEGQEEFSRPQILRRVRAASTAKVNREDALRSFAGLLRAGRFKKTAVGRFQISADSQFNPKERAG